MKTLFAVFHYLWERALLRQKQCTKCGKRCYQVERYRNPDNTSKWSYVIQPDDEQYCSNCLEQSCIQCAWCGESIKVGHPVTLYSPREGVVMPDHAVLYTKDPLRYIGCVRRTCCDIFDRQGFWHPPGRLYRVASATEESLLAIQRGESGVVICNNIGDVSRATPVSEQ